MAAEPRIVSSAAGRMSMCGICHRRTNKKSGQSSPIVSEISSGVITPAEDGCNTASCLPSPADLPAAAILPPFAAVNDDNESASSGEGATPAHNPTNNVKCFPQHPPPIIQKSEITHGSPLLGTPRGAAGDSATEPPINMLNTPEKPARRLQLIKPIRRWRRTNDSTTVELAKRSLVNSPLAAGGKTGAGLALNSLVTQVARADQAAAAAAERAAAPTSAALALTDLNTGPYLPPPLPEHDGKPVLVLDLDETLVHSSFVEVQRYDFLIPVEIEGITHAIYVAKRPGVDEFLLQVAKWYEVVIFTASLEKYASPLMDKLDPAKCCTHRLFRERCILWNGQYVKDLGRLGRKVERIVILDNSPSSYAFQPQNAIPIGSWFDDLADNELPSLLPLLNELSRMASIPAAIANAAAAT